MKISNSNPRREALPVRTLAVTVSAGLGGMAAAFIVTVVACFVGALVEKQWNTILISWEITPLAVMILAMVGGAVAGIVGSFFRSAALAIPVGALGVGSFLTWMCLRSGGPTGVVIWGSTVGFISGAVAAVVGQLPGRRLSQNTSDIAVAALITVTGSALGAVWTGIAERAALGAACGAAIGLVIGLAVVFGIRRWKRDQVGLDEVRQHPPSIE